MTAPQRWRRPAVTVAATLTALTFGATVASAGQDRPAPGADGAGDSYYPQDGNGGYDVSDYDLKVAYAPDSRQLTGLQTVNARATQSLSSFNLDLRGLTVDSVKVNGLPAQFSRTGDHELVITPRNSLARGLRFSAEIAYHGVPEAIPGAIGEDGSNGWQHTRSGGAFAAGQPQSAMTWYPANETPRDKARFRLAVTVPDEWKAISNGREAGTFKTAGGTTHVWSEDTPAAPYMTTLAIDKWTLNKRQRADGTPIVSAYAPGIPDTTKQADARLPEILDFLESKFGKYPASAAGGIYLNEQIPYSLETMSRPIYSGGAGDIGTIVHENAHQWYGDSVAVDKWKDICLNECFASYATWQWEQAKDGVDLDARYFDEIAANGEKFWAGKLYDMGPGNEFTDVYFKGPVMLHALSKYVGQEAFDRVLKTWPALHRDGNVNMQEFQRYVEEVSHKDLQGFFDAWIYRNGKPAPEYLYPGDLKPVPVVASPAKGASVRPGAAVSGTAAPGQRVSVTVDGAAVAETGASKDGAWRTTLPVNLAPGQHTLTAASAGQKRQSAPVPFTLTPAGESALHTEQTFVPEARAGANTVLTVSFAAPKGMPVSTTAEQRFVAPTGFRFTGLATHVADTGGPGRDLRTRIEDDGRILVVLDPIQLNLPGSPAGADHRTLQMTVTADKSAIGPHTDGQLTIGTQPAVPLSGTIRAA
ncbi:hypothetical protein GCM10027360_25590 [Amycolatopsis echigonensis]